MLRPRPIIGLDAERATQERERIFYGARLENDDPRFTSAPPLAYKNRHLQAVSEFAGIRALKTIPWWEPEIGEAERDLVVQVLASNFVNDGDVTLDIGCGYGAIGLAVAKLTPAGTVQTAASAAAAVDVEFDGDGRMVRFASLNLERVAQYRG